MDEGRETGIGADRPGLRNNEIMSYPPHARFAIGRRERPEGVSFIVREIVESGIDAVSCEVGEHESEEAAVRHIRILQHQALQDDVFDEFPEEIGGVETLARLRKAIGERVAKEPRDQEADGNTEPDPPA